MLHFSHKHYWFGLVAVVLLFLAQPLVSLAQGPNLIQNPGFEEPYAVLPDKENCAIAAPWIAWWQQGSADEVKKGYRLAPEYKAAFRADFPGNRVRNGAQAQQFFHSFGNFEAGVLQQVPNVPVGARLRFELWGMTWSCDNERESDCDNATSGDPSPMHFRIGIDPTGGTNVFSEEIVWSPEQDAYDSWHLFQVEAVAKQPTVTVFVYTYPTYRSQDNNVYLDDASLVVVQPPSTPTRRPTNTPTVAPVPTETPLPTNTPPPTNTPVPTAIPSTPTPFPTCVPTLAPQPCPTCPPPVIPTPVTSSVVQQLTTGPSMILALVVGAAALAVGLLLGRRSS